MHDAYIGGRFQWTKITRKASDTAENLQLYGVVRFFHTRSSCMTTHILADVQRITLNDDLGWKNQTTRYTLPRHWLYEWFSQFRVVELIRFFHGALQFLCI